MAVDELPQVVLIVPFEVVSGEGPTVEVPIRFGHGVSDQGAEVLSGVVHAVIIGTASADLGVLVDTLPTGTAAADLGITNCPGRS